jgi:hypothetical protein
MARYNEILVGRFNRALQKLVGVKGEAPAPQIASDIQPVLAFPVGAEFRYLESWDRFGAQVSVPAGAAANSIMRVRNPLANNVIAVIEKITIQNNSGSISIAIGPFSGGDLATIQTPARLDARGRPRAATILSFAPGAPAGVATLWVAAIPVSPGVTEVITTDFQEITLLPGDILEAFQNTVNSAQSFNIWWRERYLEESERT